MINQETISRFAEFIEKGDYVAVEHMLSTADGSALSKMTFETRNNENYSAINYCFLCIKQGSVDSHIAQKKIADLLLAKNPDAQIDEGIKEFYDDIYEAYFFQSTMKLVCELIRQGNIDQIEGLLSGADEETKEVIAVMDVERVNGKSYPITNYCLLFINKSDIESYVTQKEIADLLIENGAPTNSPDYRGRSYDDICAKLFYEPMLKNVLILMDRYIESPSERSYEEFSRFVDYLNPTDRNSLAQTILDAKSEPSFGDKTTQLDRILEVTSLKLDERLEFPPFPIWHDDIDDIQLDRPEMDAVDPVNIDNTQTKPQTNIASPVFAPTPTKPNITYPQFPWL